MDRLSLHIEYLLHHHDCVIIPGFGAFILVKHPAFFDLAAETWRPPVREIRFNSSVSTDDGLLANSFARKYRISHAAGRNLLEESIGNLRNLLLAEREVTIGNIGRIAISEGNLVFSPAFSPEKAAGSVGQFPVSIPGKNDIISTPDTIGNEKTQKIDPDLATVQKSRTFDFDRNYYIAVNKTVAKVAISLLLVLACCLGVMIPISDNGKRIDQAALAPVPQVEAIIKMSRSKNEPSKPAVDPKPASADTPAKTQDPSQPQSPSEINEKSKQFHVIVGTFKTRSEAENFIKTKKNLNSSLEILPSARLFRVSAKSSDNSQELYQTINRPEFKNKFKEAWIWETK